MVSPDKMMMKNARLPVLPAPMYPIGPMPAGPPAMNPNNAGLSPSRTPTDLSQLISQLSAAINSVQAGAVDFQNSYDNVRTHSTPATTHFAHVESPVRELGMTDNDGNEYRLRDQAGQFYFQNGLGTSGIQLTTDEAMQHMRPIFSDDVIKNAFQFMGKDLPFVESNPKPLPKHLELIDTPEELNERIHQELNKEAEEGRRIRKFKGDLRIGEGKWWENGLEHQGAPTKEELKGLGLKDELAEKIVQPNRPIGVSDQHRLVDVVSALVMLLGQPLGFDSPIIQSLLLLFLRNCDVVVELSSSEVQPTLILSVLLS
jgi:hypothetical protein